MVKLSDRLAVIAGDIHTGETVADIGTDHGLLPIFLWENRISPKVVLIDINEGPLEKAKENIRKHLPGQELDMRLGSGIEPLREREVDTVVIAGMGGLLMADILSVDLKKSKSFSKYILQPRNAPDKLRKWLLTNGFMIEKEHLVQEGRFLCEVITVRASDADAEECGKLEMGRNGLEELSEQKIEQMEEALDLEISPLLFAAQDPLLPSFIENKLRVEQKILADILHGTAEPEENRRRNARLEIVKKRIALLEQKKEQCRNGGNK